MTSSGEVRRSSGNLLVLFFLAIGVIYSAPNLYPPDAAIQISASSGSQELNQNVLDIAVKALEKKSIAVKATETTDRNLNSSKKQEVSSKKEEARNKSSQNRTETSSESTLKDVEFNEGKYLYQRNPTSKRYMISSLGKELGS